MQAIPGYGNFDVLSARLTPWHPLPKPGFCRRSLVCHQGFGSGGGSSKQQALPSAVTVRVPSLTFSLASGFSAETLPSRYGEQFYSKAPPPITHCSHFCCMPVINFSIVVKIKNGLVETAGGNQKHFSVFYVKPSGTCHIIPIKSTNPGLPGSQGFTPRQHDILAWILFHFHLHPQMPSFSFLPSAFGPPFKGH